MSHDFRASLFKPLLFKPLFGPLLMAASLSLTISGPAASQGLFPFFNPGVSSRNAPSRRGPARVRVVSRHPAAIPMPVPRPHFGGDLAATPRSVPTPSAAAPMGPAPPASPPPPARPDKPAFVAAPAVAPSGATTAFNPRQPPADDTCPRRLQAAGVKAASIAIGPQPDARCMVVLPVRLAELTTAEGTRIAFPDQPTIACVTADTFARYVRELLIPLAKGTYGVPVDAVWTGPGLECRSRDHIVGAKLSAHGQGLAIDVAQLQLADGRRIAVGEPKTAADQAFETAARAAGCGYFHTALGPGTDSYHRTHWHFDLEERGTTGDGKYCR